MQTKPSFIEFIQHICTRPRMYTLGGTYNETAAFITGFSEGSESPINDRIFDRFVCLKHAFPTNYVWTYVIKECSKDDHEGISLMMDTILEFIELRNTMTEEELMQFAMKSSKSKEGDAENVFRKFESALLTRDREIIQSLIFENEHAEILWAESYPKDLALQLSEVYSIQPLKKNSVFEDRNKIKIIASAWPFPIEMDFINGNWRINAEKIIALQMNKK